jgi:hypothetical protein
MGLHMSKPGTAALAAVVMLAVAAGGCTRVPESAMDLIDAFDEAEKRAVQPIEEAFAVREVEIDGERRRVIAAHPQSRIIWRFTMPRHALLQTWLAVEPEVWGLEGDGVQFRIGVSDGRQYDELLRQHVDPMNRPGDRRWIPVTLDLSEYQGHAVELIFNTDHSPPDVPVDPRNDRAVWGEPAILVAR